MPVRLNLGCGDCPREGFVNVDARPVGDVVARVEQLPFQSYSVDWIAAADVLEHFPRTEISRVLLEWRRVLKIDGRLNLRVPNMLELGKLLAAEVDVDRVMENVYGGHRWPGLDEHHWGWTPNTLRRTLNWNGFRVKAIDDAPNMTVWAIRE